MRDRYEQSTRTGRVFDLTTHLPRVIACSRYNLNRVGFNNLASSEFRYCHSASMQLNGHRSTVPFQLFVKLVKITARLTNCQVLPISSQPETHSCISSNCMQVRFAILEHGISAIGELNNNRSKRCNYASS